jgi:hypothetical protein
MPSGSAADAFTTDSYPAQRRELQMLVSRHRPAAFAAEPMIEAVPIHGPRSPA